MESYPQVFEKNRSLVVKFSSAAETGRRLPIRMVLDFDRERGVVGIEIINLFLRVGKRALECIQMVTGTSISRQTYSYDDESDAFYLRLKDGTSVDQKAVQGLVVLDDEARIVALATDWT